MTGPPSVSMRDVVKVTVDGTFEEGHCGHQVDRGA